MMYTGTSSEQDTRFSNKEKKLLKSLKFPDCFSKKVDISKLQLDAIKPWIDKKVTEILGAEDDVVVEFICNQLEYERFPDPKKIQINLTGFLNAKNARSFMTELWQLLFETQNSASGMSVLVVEKQKPEDKKMKNEKWINERERVVDIVLKKARDIDKKCSSKEVEEAPGLYSKYRCEDYYPDRNHIYSKNFVAGGNREKTRNRSPEKCNYSPGDYYSNAGSRSYKISKSENKVSRFNSFNECLSPMDSSKRSADYGYDRRSYSRTRRSSSEGSTSSSSVYSRSCRRRDRQSYGRDRRSHSRDRRSHDRRSHSRGTRSHTHDRRTHSRDRRNHSRDRRSHIRDRRSHSHENYRNSRNCENHSPVAEEVQKNFDDFDICSREDTMFND